MRIRFVDADTVSVPGLGPVRLAGIDAPELGQPAKLGRRTFDAGAHARDALAAEVAGRRREGFRVVLRDSRERDRYGRTVGVLGLEHADGRTIDLNAWLVAQGLAVAEYGRQYTALERAARRRRVGLWRSAWERPKDYRRRKRESTDAQWLRRTILAGLFAGRRSRPTGVLGILRLVSRLSRLLR